MQSASRCFRVLVFWVSYRWLGAAFKAAVVCVGSLDAVLDSTTRKLEDTPSLVEGIDAAGGREQVYRHEQRSGPWSH